MRYPKQIERSHATSRWLAYSILTMAAAFLLLCLSSAIAEGASDSKKFHLLHPIKEEESCISEKCHPEVKKVKYVHAPVATGVCVVCHGKIVSNPISQ
jgi:hypothetical protein